MATEYISQASENLKTVATELSDTKDQKEEDDDSDSDEDDSGKESV